MLGMLRSGRITGVCDPAWKHADITMMQSAIFFIVIDVYFGASL